MEQPTTETRRPPASPDQIPPDQQAVLVLVTTTAPGADRLRLASLPPAEARRLLDALLNGGARGTRRARARSSPVDWGLLTDREREIAELAGQALTNRQIATRVGRSPHTVNYHLRQIFRKLGLASRVELAALLRDEARSQPRPGRPPQSRPQTRTGLP
ncbi:helix-turn-helix transcriptional regulator [Actinoplanes sp. NPDC051513]|uniref:helix-turn-helix transcriptional regulator n=1 Tax=Actinoplanes sp. NPDC051513 TaxID=3363908 RepID=UPI0037BAA862